MPGAHANVLDLPRARPAAGKIDVLRPFVRRPLTSCPRFGFLTSGPNPSAARAAVPQIKEPADAHA
jgi:hypothetical protein